MKPAIIIDSYPETDEQKKRLVKILNNFKQIGFDVLLTSHNVCDSEIINSSKYFLFEKENNYHFLDSDILNKNITQCKEPSFMKYTCIGDKVFYDRLVVTAWSVAITSQMFNAIKFLYGKGYDFAFYMVDDFNFPVDFEEKIKNIFKKIKNKRNYFIKNQEVFSSWFAGFFFGFTIDSTLIDRLPNLDFSQNDTYQNHFPNFSCEDVLNELWLNDENYIDPHEELNNLFGIGNWNLDSSVVKSGASTLHYQTSSSIYVNSDSNNIDLMLYVSDDSIFNNVIFNLKISDENQNILYTKNIDLMRGWFFIDDLSELLFHNKKLLFEKEVIGYSDTINYFKDKILIDTHNIEYYKKLKNFKKI